MKKSLIWTLLYTMLFIPTLFAKGDTMQFRSSAFVDNTPIPEVYTCFGEGEPIPLAWSGAPEGTQSFVMIMDDPDAVGGVYDHWIIYDLPADTPGIIGGIIPAGAKMARASDGRAHYVPPCPPKGSGLHHYTFRPFALDIPHLPGSPETKAEVIAAMEGHILAEAKLIGLVSPKEAFAF